MKKTRTANLHHLYHEPLPENLKLTPKVEVDNVHQRQTTDVYEHALTITAWQQIYDQLHPGKFHGEFTEILLDDIQVFREYTGLALRQSCLVWPNSFWFGIPATRGEQGFIGSQCLGSAEIATRPGGTEFELSTPDDYTILAAARHNDIEIPTLCYLKHVSHVASCRVCVVEVEGSDRLAAACDTPVPHRGRSW